MELEGDGLIVLVDRPPEIGDVLLHFDGVAVVHERRNWAGFRLDRRHQHQQWRE